MSLVPLNPFKLITIAMASPLSPFTRASAVTKTRQLAPTVGPAHDGFEFLKGSFPGIEGYTVGRMTKSRRGKLYIDDAGWGPEADSIEYGYRVPFGEIHVFIGKIRGSDLEPDICTDIVEPARCTQPAQVQPIRKRVLIGFMQGMELAEDSESGGETLIYSGDEASTGEMESIY